VGQVDHLHAAILHRRRQDVKPCSPPRR